MTLVARAEVRRGDPNKGRCTRCASQRENGKMLSMNGAQASSSKVGRERSGKDGRRGMVVSDQ